MDDAAFDQACLDIYEDRHNGAATLARQGLAVLAESARTAPASDAAALADLLTRRADRLAGLRPAMTPPLTLARRFCAGLPDPATAGDDLHAFRRASAAEADRLVAESRRASRGAAQALAARLPAGARLVTISNSSTLRELFAVLAEADPPPTVSVLEGRPLCEGRILAGHAADLGLRTTLAPEAQMARLVAGADAVVLGADSVLADGGVVNKTGSHPLALCARAAGVPVYVCAESFKQRPADMGEPAAETVPAADLGPLPPGVGAEAVAFETVPADLVTAWVCEAGTG